MDPPADTTVALDEIQFANGDGRNVDDMTPGSNGVGMNMAEAMYDETDGIPDRFKGLDSDCLVISISFVVNDIGGAEMRNNLLYSKLYIVNNITNAPKGTQSGCFCFDFN